MNRIRRRDGKQMKQIERGRQSAEAEQQHDLGVRVGLGGFDGGRQSHGHLMRSLGDT